MQLDIMLCHIVVFIPKPPKEEEYRWKDEIRGKWQLRYL
jgi:hypothetical protein